jgi:hypothetical protein
MALDTTNSDQLQAAIPLLCCPDCGAGVIASKGELRCLHSNCGRVFLTHEGGIIDMAAKEQAPWRLGAGECHFRPVEKSYSELCLVPFGFEGNGPPWGDIAGAPDGYLRFIAEYGSLIRELLGQPAQNQWLVDISGGSGFLLRMVCGGWRGAIHLDAHLPSLRAAAKRALQAGLHNIVFVRGSYLKPPIKPNSASAVLTTDTIIRNSHHNRLLLKNILAIMAPGGKAIVDVHARTLLRRAPVSSVTCDYSRANFLKLLTEEGFETVRLTGGGYVPSTRSWPRPAFWAFELSARTMHWPSRWAALAVRA